MKRREQEVSLTWEEMVVLMILLRDRIASIEYTEMDSPQYELHLPVVGSAYAKLMRGKDSLTKSWQDTDNDE